MGCDGNGNPGNGLPWPLNLDPQGYGLRSLNDCSELTMRSSESQNKNRGCLRISVAGGMGCGVPDESSFCEGMVHIGELVLDWVWQ
jgi:hypothetical protein